MSDSGMITTEPSIPSVTPKSGWLTSQGQLTATFTLVCIVLSLFGIAYTPEQLTDWVDKIEHYASVLLPLITAIFPLMSYITSRGKIASNALKANADIKIASLQPKPVEWDRPYNHRC